MPVVMVVIMIMIMIRVIVFMIVSVVVPMPVVMIMPVVVVGITAMVMMVVRRGVLLFHRGPRGVRLVHAPGRRVSRTRAIAAPKPLSMFTTVTPAAQLDSMPSSAAMPPSEAP